MGMPKMKSQRSAVKRFKLTARGKIRRKHAYHSHLLSRKRPDRRRRLRQDDFVVEREAGRIRKLLPYRGYLG